MSNTVDEKVKPKEIIEKMKGESLDIIKQNVLKLKEIFPEVFCEDKIDFKRLEEVLGEYTDDSDERYRFEWHGKSKAIKIAQTPSRGTLRPCKEESKNWDSTENLYIEGDNLEVLKLLQKSYQGKIKMIYIDPPYNTGNDFVYPDDYSDNLDNYLRITRQKDKEGNTTTTNCEVGGRYHTNWLNMMYPRLRLAKNLLSEDGAIFISIDDNELSNLKRICDEIFGEENLISTHHIQVRYAEKSLADGKSIKPVMEYILIYAKSMGLFKINLPKEEYTDENFVFKINEKENGKIIEYADGSKVEVFLPGQWSIEKKDIPNTSLLKETWISGTIYSKMSYGQVVKKYIEPRYEVDGLGCLYKVIGRGDDGLGYRYYVGPVKEKSTRCKMYSGMPLSRIEEINSENGSYREVPISNLMNYAPDFGNIVNEGGVKFNGGKKPIKMLKELINYSDDKSAMILDFFSGSSSTGHATMSLNSEDDGKRKFILVQLPEQCDEKTDAFKAGYKNICEIGKERIRRAGDKIIEENKDKEGIEDLDIGFKVFKLDTSNIKPWNPDYDNLEMTLEDSVDNFVPYRTEDDIVYEIMLKYGIDLTYPVETKEVDGKKIFIIGFGALLVCLDDEITLEVVNEIVKLKEELNPDVCRVVFKDNGFKSDSVKTNAVEILNRNKIKDIMSI